MAATFVSAPEIRIGGANAKIAKIFARGTWARALCGIGTPSPMKAIEHDVTVERSGLITWRVRLWWRDGKLGWYSPGYHAMSIVGLLAMSVRASLYLRRKRRDFPRARVEERGPR